MEVVYATHANKLKALANDARKESIATPNIKQIPSARETYKSEVESLRAALNLALRNAPLERQAQIVARTKVDAVKLAHPDMDASDVKKVNGQALQAARNRVGAKKDQIEITDKQWEAIQSGAISTNFLNEIIDHADRDTLLALATPRTLVTMTPVKIDRARAMLSSGYTQAEVAEALGVSISTIAKSLKP
jgi:DNA-binding transcriptional regulator YiaG